MLLGSVLILFLCMEVLGSEITRIQTNKGVGEFSQPRSFLNLKTTERPQKNVQIGLFDGVFFF